MIENQKQYYPPMHTAEHILNQTMVRMFGVERSNSNHIERKKSKCDYVLNRELTGEEITILNREINLIIKEDLPVTEEFISIDAASKLFDMNRLPESFGQIVRVVRVGNYDVCPCSGVHVKSTAEIGEFFISSCTFEEGKLRIRFKLIEKN